MYLHFWAYLKDKYEEVTLTVCSEMHVDERMFQTEVFERNETRIFCSLCFFSESYCFWGVQTNGSECPRIIECYIHFPIFNIQHTAVVFWTYATIAEQSAAVFGTRSDDQSFLFSVIIKLLGLLIYKCA